MRRVARLAAALLLALVAERAAAQAPVRFFVDSIRVEGLRHSSERVILSQSRLVAGREYAEPELHAGAARVSRLPFVVRAELRIEKGATRGAYALVIQVTEAKPLFFGATALLGDVEEGRETEAVTAGGRLFTGRSGMFHAAATAATASERFELGYTHYDLFGTGAFVSARARYSGYDAPIELSATERIDLAIVAGVPLRGNHAVRASLTRDPTIIRLAAPLQRQPGPPPPRYLAADITTAAVAWVYDSTDDPLFPTRGSSVVAEGLLRRRTYTTVTTAPPLIATPVEETHLGYSLEAERHWLLTSRGSLFADGYYRHSMIPMTLRRELRPVPWDRWGVQGGYALTLPQRASGPLRVGDVRIEGALRYDASHYQVSGGAAFVPRTVSGPSARIGLAVRNAWGVFRVTFTASEVEAQ